MRACALLIALPLLVACESSARDSAVPAQDSAPPAPAQSDVQHGIAARRNDRFDFVPCGATDTLRLDASEPLASVITRLKPDSAGAFVIARLASRTHADSVFYATRDRFECHADWSSFDYRATGNDPGWVAEVKNSALHIRRQGARDTVAQITQASGPALSFSTSGTPAITLVLTWQACSQGSGAHFGWSARLAVANTTLNGCAVRGLAQR
jgi:uncharacterized membrane protein